MISLHERFISPASPSDVFDYLLTFERITEWDPGIVAAERIGDGEPEVGTRFLLVSRFYGQEQELRYQIRSADGPRKLVLVGHGDRVEAIDTIELRPVGSGTEVDYRADIRMRGLAAVAEPLMKPLMVRMGRKAVSGLRRELEKLAAAVTASA